MLKCKKMLSVVFGLAVGASSLICVSKAEKLPGGESQSLISSVRTDSVLKNENGEFVVQNSKSFSRSKTMTLTLNVNKLKSAESNNSGGLGFLDSYFLAKYVACVLTKDFSSKHNVADVDEANVNVWKTSFKDYLRYNLYLEFPLQEAYNNAFESYIDGFKTENGATNANSLKDLVKASLNNLGMYKENLGKILDECGGKLSSLIENLKKEQNSLSNSDSSNDDLFPFDFSLFSWFFDSFDDEEAKNTRIERINKKIAHLNAQLERYNEMKNGVPDSAKQYLANLLNFMDDKVSTGFCEMSSVSRVVAPKKKDVGNL